MASAAESDTTLRAVPAERITDQLRRRWRSRGRHTNLTFWLLYRGMPIVAGLLVVYTVSGFAVGWTTAYEVMLGITSPADTSVPAVAWVLSVSGWLVAPTVAGAVAGFVIGAQIKSRRRASVDDLFRAHVPEDGHG
jgi:hypothetical protein